MAPPGRHISALRAGWTEGTTKPKHVSLSVPMFETRTFNFALSASIRGLASSAPSPMEANFSAVWGDCPEAGLPRQGVAEGEPMAQGSLPPSLLGELLFNVADLARLSVRMLPTAGTAAHSAIAAASCSRPNSWYKFPKVLRTVESS